MRTIRGIAQANLRNLQRRNRRKRVKPPPPSTRLYLLKEEKTITESISSGDNSSEEELSLPTPSCSEEETQSRSRRKRTKPQAPIRLPNRHRSLIGHQDERLFLKKSLNLFRLPCNLVELRFCRKMWKLCCEVSDLAAAYSNIYNKYRGCLKDFLNQVLRIPIRSLLDTKSIKYECYSPNLPVWLYRKIIKALHIGNNFCYRSLPC